jgi:hypothetical protein
MSSGAAAGRACARLIAVDRESAAKILEKALGRGRCELTVADAATRSGLPMREAADGLSLLAAQYTGHVAATAKGELIYQFPRGLVRSAVGGRLRQLGRATARLALGVGRFVVRAWVSVLLVGYALVFAGVLIALAARSDDDGPGEALGVLLRVLGETLFWTFHPFSPVAIGREPGWIRLGGRRRRTATVPFYERVNRFVFGIPAPPPDPREADRKILVEIRRQKGRIVPADLMRITGATRDESERRLLQLVADQDGDIGVSDEGALIYRFPELRTTTAGALDSRGGPPPVWSERKSVPPLTGNGAGFNVLFTAVNGFNLIASGVALHAGLTLDRIGELLSRVGNPEALPLSPPDGVPLVLGAIPFVFSLTLFALPAIRALRRPSLARRVAGENGRRGLLRLLLREEAPATARASLDEKHPVPALASAWAASAGRAPGERELDEAVRALGGSVELDQNGALVYDFELLARERAAVAAERSRASIEEASPGRVVFSSAD